MSHVVITYFLFSQAIVVEFMKWGTQQGKQGPQRHIPLHNQVAENREWMLRAGTDVATTLAFFPPLRPAANSVWYLDILCIEQKPWIWHIFYLKSGSVLIPKLKVPTQNPANISEWLPWVLYLKTLEIVFLHLTAPTVWKGIQID